MSKIIKFRQNKNPYLKRNPVAFQIAFAKSRANAWAWSSSDLSHGASFPIVTMACISKAFSRLACNSEMNASQAIAGRPSPVLSHPRACHVAFSLLESKHCFSAALSFCFHVHGGHVFKYLRFGFWGKSVCLLRKLHRMHLMRSDILQRLKRSTFWVATKLIYPKWTRGQDNGCLWGPIPTNNSMWR